MNLISTYRGTGLPMANVSIVDDILQNVVHLFEASFPARVRGYYLYGSQIDDTAVNGSDIDITILFKDGFTDELEQNAALKVAASLVYPIKSDIEIVDEKTLVANPSPTFKLSSRCFFGADVRDQLSLMPIEAWTRDRMHTSYWRIIKLFKRATPVTLPLHYPNPQDEFYGYLQSENSADGTPSTRDLLRSVTWAATGLIALHAKQYVTRKVDCYPMYQHYINDEWAPFIQESYTRCKLEWNYAIPDERSALRELCSRVVTFENHFLNVYQSFLTAELENLDEAIAKQALWVLSQIPFEESQVLAALEAAKQRFNGN